MNKKWRLGGALVAALAMMAVLAALRSLLTVPSGYDVEDFLGWKDDVLSGPAIEEMAHLWQRRLGAASPWVQGLYLGLDIALFMPLYGLVLVGLWWQLQRDFATHSS
jgi:hypothetical protein